ncbi:MAG: hypothetical protein JWP18_2053, partial [Solirubrobacterales bacterium]|nr:hypothetical protein [Solirubrobacterales bacterium]
MRAPPLLRTLPAVAVVVALSGFAVFRVADDLGAPAPTAPAPGSGGTPPVAGNAPATSAAPQIRPA